MITSSLKNVPETTLWTLYNRASECLRPDAKLHDPKCVEIYQSIEYDYHQHFGTPDYSHAARSLIFDEAIKNFISKYPNAVIINLGEGLETQRFRIQAPGADWYSIDLPEAIAFRERFITPDEHHHHIAKSALDTSWFDEIPKNRPVFISAQGLFMYFTEDDLRTFFRALSQRFPGARIMFDYLNTLFSQKSISEKGWWKTKYYRTPPMPWGLNRDQLAPTLSRWLGTPIKPKNDVYRMTRGFWRLIIIWAEKYCPRLLNKAPGICHFDLPEKLDTDAKPCTLTTG